MINLKFTSSLNRVFPFKNKLFHLVFLFTVLLCSQNIGAQCIGPANDCDGDGILNVDDQDDDNDGILDTDECIPNAIAISSVSSSVTLNSGSLDSLIDGISGSFSPFVSILQTTPYPWDIEFTLANTATVSSCVFSNNGGSALGQYVVTYDLIFFDGSGVEITRINGFNLSNTFAPQVANFSAVENVSSITLSITSGVSNPEFNEVSFGICDTDSDGIANYEDLDSDNDGCYDALEGDGGFTFANIDANGALTGGVDALTGIPTAAGAGQQKGSSDNSAIFNGVCDDDGDGVLDADDICQGFDDALDNDNDGVPDGCDQDDDNDGILDTIECPSANTSLEYSTRVGQVLSPTEYATTATVTGATISATNGPFHFIAPEDAPTYSIGFDRPVKNIALHFGGVNDDSEIGNFSLLLRDGTLLTNVDFRVSFDAADDVLGGLGYEVADPNTFGGRLEKATGAPFFTSKFLYVLQILQLSKQHFFIRQKIMPN